MFDTGQDSITFDDCISSTYIALYLFIFFPFTLYHAKKYFDNREHIVYKKRYSIIVLIEVFIWILKVITVIIYRSFVLFYGEKLRTNDFDTNAYLVANNSIAITLYYCWVNNIY